MQLNRSFAFNITLAPKNDSTKYAHSAVLLPDQNQTLQAKEHFSFEISTGDKIILGCLSLLGLLIVVANLTVLGLAKKRKFLRVKPNYIIISLAFSDFFSGALGIPLLVACNTTGEQPLCIGMDVCQRFLAISTILHLATDVVNRYFRIVKPFVYRRTVTVHRLVRLILLLWVVSLTGALVQIVWVGEPDSEKQYPYQLAVFIIVVFVPFLVIVFACAQMFRAIRQRMDSSETKKGRSLKRTERRALTVYCMMTTCFVIGWFPYFLLTILEDAGFIIILPYWLSIVLLFLKYGTSLSDPLLYALSKTDFQKGLKTFLMGPTAENESSFLNKSFSGKTSRNSTRENNTWV